MNGTQLKRRREKAGLTQKALAKKVGLTNIMLSYYENNKRPISRTAMLALDNVLREEEGVK